MNRVLGLVFVFLLIIITAEAGYFWYLRQQKSNTKSPTSNLKPQTSKNQQQPEISPFEVSNIVTTKAHDGSDISYVYAIVTELPTKEGILVFRDKKGNRCED